MNAAFERDDLPGRPRILFVGFAHSSHTHAWIDLVRETCNVRLYAVPLGFPPDDWPVRTYITQSTPRRFDPTLRRKLYPLNRLDRDVRNWLVRRFYGRATDAPRLGLARVIRHWRPQVVQALGLDPAGRFVRETRERFGLGAGSAWVLQLRGGSDLALRHRDPEARPGLARDVADWDAVLTDNRPNFAILQDLGLPASRLASLAPVPGTGGVDPEALRVRWRGEPAGRRDILWPKAYECPWSKSLPVLEALRLCRDRLAGRVVHMLACDAETRAWWRTLPADVRAVCRVRERIPREALLDLLGGCRVLLAPSLVDGVPNSLYEAMALGALPIVSPLDTIAGVVRAERNVLFARNLHPEEMAAALVRALDDDALVARATRENAALVGRIAHRRLIAPRVLAFYEQLAGRAERDRPQP